MPTQLVITGLAELAKLALQMYFIAMQTAGKSEEELTKFYDEQKAYFLANHPSTFA